MPFDSPERSAIVVLGCRVDPSGALCDAAIRRVERAAALFHALKPSLVIASGGAHRGRATEADAFGRQLAARGVPEDRLRLERTSLSTFENAAHVSELLAEEAVRSVYLVTCDFHMPRALSYFSWFGITAVPEPVPSPKLSLLRAGKRRTREWLAERWDARRTWPGPNLRGAGRE